MHKPSGYAVGHVGKSNNGKFTAVHSDGHVSRHQGKEAAVKSLVSHYNAGKVISDFGGRKPAAEVKKPSSASSSQVADKLAMSSEPQKLARTFSNDDLDAADKELTRRAAVLGQPGKVARHHMAVKAEIARRGGVADEDFAGPHHSFPIKDKNSIGHAVSLAHHAEDPGAIRARIKEIAQRKFPGTPLPASLQG